VSIQECRRKEEGIGPFRHVVSFEGKAVKSCTVIEVFGTVDSLSTALENASAIPLTD